LPSRQISNPLKPDSNPRLQSISVSQKCLKRTDESDENSCLSLSKNPNPSRVMYPALQLVKLAMQEKTTTRYRYRANPPCYRARPAIEALTSPPTAQPDPRNVHAVSSAPYKHPTTLAARGSCSPAYFPGAPEPNFHRRIAGASSNVAIATQVQALAAYCIADWPLEVRAGPAGVMGVDLLRC